MVDADGGLTRNITLNEDLEKVITASTGTTGIELVFNQPAIIKTDDNFSGVIIKGLNKGSTYDFLSKALVSGRMPNDSLKMKLRFQKLLQPLLD